MKTKLIFILLLIISISYSQTSIYHPFPEASLNWNYNSYQFPENQCSYSITNTEDTIINSLIYRKLDVLYVETVSGSCCPAPGYRGALREDIDSKKVYFIPPGATTEQLLYDFNLEVGDSLKGYLENTPECANIVSSIDSVLVNNFYHKRWGFGGSVSIIEGVGSTFGLINMLNICLTGNPMISLTCMQHNGLTIFPESEIDCQLITNIDKKQMLDYALKIYPNPSDGLFVIESREDVEIDIIDITGKKIYTKHLFSPVNHTINNSNVGKGVFIIKASFRNKIQYRKLIIK